MAAKTLPAASNESGRLRNLDGAPGRRLVIGISLGLIGLVGITIWRMGSLDGLPDVGDPFDVSEARRPVEIPDADNAFEAYAAAHAAGGPGGAGRTRGRVLGEAEVRRLPGPAGGAHPPPIRRKNPPQGPPLHPRRGPRPAPGGGPPPRGAERASGGGCPAPAG